MGRGGGRFIGLRTLTPKRTHPAGALKPSFDAGFSGDWATATHRAALAASSRLPQEDAYRFDANKAGKS